MSAAVRPASRMIFIMPAADKRFTVTPAGFAWFAGIGLDVAAVKPTRRGLARQCLDWTERTHHLAGPLGVQFMTTLCANGWLRRAKESRAVETTPKGRVELMHHLGIDADALRLRPDQPQDSHHPRMGEVGRWRAGLRDRVRSGR